MNFNSRVSVLPAIQQQSRTRKREDEADAFMRLPDKEIVGCITDIGFRFSVTDLQKPNAAQVQQIFEWFAELLLNATRDTVEPAMRAAAEKACGVDQAEVIFPPDARNLLGFYVSLRRLLLECGIADFGFADLFRPVYDRLVKIFSYLINFVRFRESQTSIIDEHFSRTENAKTRIEAQYATNEDADRTLESLRCNQRAMEAQVREKTRRNEELKRQLLDLRRSQERVAARLDEAKARKTVLATALEDRATTWQSIRQEVAKLRPYTLQSPAALQTTLTGLAGTLAADRTAAEALDRRARALQTSSDALGNASADVSSCLRLLDEASAELAREAEEGVKVSRQREALSERGNNAREVERAESLLQRQLAKWAERTERLREQVDARAREARDHMVELRATHARMSEEHADKSRETERRRVRIEQTEKKMQDLKENIETEVHATHDEYLKMEAHVKLFITEMEQAIT